MENRRKSDYEMRGGASNSQPGRASRELEPTEAVFDEAAFPPDASAKKRKRARLKSHLLPEDGKNSLAPTGRRRIENGKPANEEEEDISGFLGITSPQLKKNAQSILSALQQQQQQPPDDPALKAALLRQAQLNQISRSSDNRQAALNQSLLMQEQGLLDSGVNVNELLLRQAQASGHAGFDPSGRTGNASLASLMSSAAAQSGSGGLSNHLVPSNLSLYQNMMAGASINGSDANRRANLGGQRLLAGNSGYLQGTQQDSALNAHLLGASGYLHEDGNNGFGDFRGGNQMLRNLQGQLSLAQNAGMSQGMSSSFFQQQGLFGQSSPNAEAATAAWLSRNGIGSISNDSVLSQQRFGRNIVNDPSGLGASLMMSNVFARSGGEMARNSPDGGGGGTHSPVTLYMSCDDESLSDYQCLVRKHIELFAAGNEDVESNAQGRNKPIVLGQVGIRCKHCASLSPRHRARGATYYPAKLHGLYQAAQNMASSHLCGYCQHIPEALRQELHILRDRKSSAGGGKQYWADGVRVQGVVEDKDGLRFKEN